MEYGYLLGYYRVKDTCTLSLVTIVYYKKLKFTLAVRSKIFLSKLMFASCV